MPENNSSKKVILAVAGIGCLMVGLAVLGILAAIAIPAFTRYIKASKTSEAKAMTQQIAAQAQLSWAESCSFPPALPRHTDTTTCCGGEKCSPNPQRAKAFQDIGVSMKDPTYFAYETEARGETYVVRGKADFDCDSPAQHTVEVVVKGTKDPSGSCTAEVQPAVTTNEFE